MRISRLLHAILLCNCVVLSCQRYKAAGEFAQAKAMLLEVSIKADSIAMVQSRQRFANLLENPQVVKNDSLAARVHYFIAFANWQLAFVTFGNQEGAKKLIDDALVHLEAATEKQENLVDAYVVLRRCYYWRYVLDPSTARAVWPESRAALDKARALAPEDPLVKLEEAIDLFYKPAQAGGDQQEGLARFQAAMQHFEQQPKNDIAYENWWQATAYMMLGQAYLGAENPEAAEEAFKSALAIQPNFEYVKSSMLPMTQLLTPPPVPGFDNVTWTTLATDSDGDGRNPNWADVKALSFYYDAKSDTLWFKLDLSRLPNPKAFGINLVVDTDQNQQTGASWWGNNRTFTYDRLVTVWVVKREPDSYRGTAGVADFRGVQLGRYTNLFRNNLAFRVDAEQRMMVLGIKRVELDEDGNLNLVAAVGSNAGWNDDIPDSSSVEIGLRKL